MRVMKLPVLGHYRRVDALINWEKYEQLEIGDCIVLSDFFVTRAKHKNSTILDTAEYCTILIKDYSSGAIIKKV